MIDILCECIFLIHTYYIYSYLLTFNIVVVNEEIPGACCEEKRVSNSAVQSPILICGKMESF